ncbi:MAG: TlpA disulfide reductase family protein [Rubrivivax sp.]|nr:TlpA disulfide reductase family protein [Rubrivivax sp.]
MAPLLLLLAVWIASWIATKLSTRQDPDADHPGLADAAGNAVFVAAGIGLLVARLAHLASHAQPYLATPVSMLDLRDGGWDAIAGALAGTAWLAWRGWRMPPFRRPLAVAAATGMLVWSAGTLFTGARDEATMPMTALSPLAGGDPVELRTAAAGRPVVVNLWASWCGPCRQEMPTLAEAQRRDSTVGFLFVNQGESEPEVRAYLASLGLPLREVLLDPGSQLGPAVGSRGLPTTLFYDAKGSLVDAHFGVLNPAALETRLQTLRAAR